MIDFIRNIHPWTPAALDGPCKGIQVHIGREPVLGETIMLPLLGSGESEPYVVTERGLVWAVNLRG